MFPSLLFSGKDFVKLVLNLQKFDWILQWHYLELKISFLGVLNYKLNFFNGYRTTQVVYFLLVEFGNLWILSNLSLFFYCQIYEYKFEVLLCHPFSSCRICSESPYFIPDIAKSFSLLSVVVLLNSYQFY